MKIYLVGGAVRDQLLGLPVIERDWVVVGATPTQLLAKQYKQVGRDFPVFLHPKTNEEYALARTERKSGVGYYGFDCVVDNTVTLEEDLARRDLTINAMAIDENGRLIDPYGGQNDITNKILRHVSPAFIEDPVRVLRVARFMARFHHLGFRLAHETRALMYTMVKKGELKYLVAERVWQEWQKSLTEKNPEQFIITLRSCDALRVVLPEFHVLFGVPNTYRHHPEVDSGIHTLMVLIAACKFTPNPVVRFAALVHDLGKGNTPMGLWPKHHGHEERGVSLVNALCARLRIPNEYKSLAMLSSRWHLIIHRILELGADTIVDTLEQTGAFRRVEGFYDLLLVCQSDFAGRGKVEGNYQQASLWQQVFAECVKVDAKTVMRQGHVGHAIRQAVHQQRIACVKLITNSWKTNEK